MPDNDKLLLLDRDVIAPALTPAGVKSAVEDAFILHSKRSGRVFPVVREKLHTGGIFGIKSGDIAEQDVLGFKAAGFWTQNRAVGGEPHQATVALFDPNSGRPLCIMDGNAITTARTGAAGALGIRLLARPDSKRICVFGTGVQAKAQLLYSLPELPNASEVSYVSFDGRPDEAFESAFKDRIDITLSRDRNASVANSDIVITATPGGGALFDFDAIQPGTHINSVGADTAGKRELPEGLLARGRVFVDDMVQAKSIGECQWNPNVMCTEIGDLLTQSATFTRGDADITIFDMTGLALQDLTVGRYLYQNAIARNVGASVPWPW